MVNVFSTNAAKTVVNDCKITRRPQASTSVVKGQTPRLG